MRHRQQDIAEKQPVLNRVQNSGLSRALAFLPANEQRALILLVLVQVFLAGIDLLAVALVGVLGTVAVAGVQSSVPDSPSMVGLVLSWTWLESLEPQQQVALLGMATGVIFIARTASSIYLIRRALHYLGIRAAEASSDLIDRLLQQPLTFLQTRTTQDFIFAVTQSVNALILGGLGSMVMIAADLAMLLGIAIFLLFISPVVALATGLLIAVLVAALHHFTTARAQHIGVEIARLDIAARDLLMEALATYRDMQVRGSRENYAWWVRDIRMQSSLFSMEAQFIPNISKYVLEAAVILGGLLIGALAFALNGAQTAVAVLAVLLAAGSRLAPAVVRLQQGAIVLRQSLGQGEYALQLDDQLGRSFESKPARLEYRVDHADFIPTVTLQNLTYTYPGADTAAVTGMSLEVRPGQLIAFVGSSGAGKSTAADLILGVLEADGGNVEISGLRPAEAERRWPGAIGYVPQDVWIADGSIRKNVALGLEALSVPDADIWAAIKVARLDDVVRTLPEGLDAIVGERGAKLSGGQRQRLGIARALLTRPRLLVLDEATSALDAETESEVSAAMQGLRGAVTIIVIAHRLAVVRDADVVVYFERGRVRASGTFDSVRKQVPDFDRQAALLGL